MSEQRRRRAAEIAAEAFEEPIKARSAFIAAACADDEMLRAEVESLLSADAEAGSFLDRPAIRSGAAATAADDAAMAGTHIDGYRIIRRIAAGGMGVVYEAEQENPPRTVAMKVIRAGAVSPQSIRRFEHEGRLLGLLHHPGIAQIFEAGTFDTGQGPQPFFAMEFIDGRPLTEFAESNGLGPRERLELFGRVCDAVHHAHQKGIIHRDLKPGNVLVDESGQPRILDFGVARLTDSDVQATTVQTTTGELIGTIPYMSPEQVTGDADALDTRSDVYSLGVCLYELLSGRLPHDLRRRPIPEAARIIREEDVTPLSSINRVFRGDIETIVAKALEKDRNRRYQSAAELATDIRRYLDDEPIIARPASTMYQLRKFARRNKALVGGAAAAFAALVVGTVLAVAGLVQASAQRDVAQTEAAKLAVVNTFWNDLLGAVKPEQAQGREVTVREMLDEAADRIEGEFDDQPLVEAELRSTIGSTYHELGIYAEAAAHHEVALRLREEQLGVEHSDTLRSMTGLATNLMILGEHADAERLHRKVLEIRREVLGDDHVDTLTAMNNLGHHLQVQRRLEEAEQLLSEAVERYRRLQGDEHPGSESAMGNLAIVLSDQGKLAEAEPLYQAVLEIDRSLTALSNLAWHYLDMGRPAEAEPLFREALEEARRIHDEDHPIVSRMMQGLSYALVHLDELDEAERLARQALEASRRRLGAEHAATLRYLQNLAVVLQQAGELPEAEALLGEQLEIRRRTQGEEHYETLVVMNSLAWQLRKRGEFGEAEALLSRTIEIARRTLGDDHPSTLYWMAHHGQTLREAGRPAEAAGVYEQVVHGRRGALGGEHPHTRDAMAILAEVYEEDQQYTEGVSLLRDFLVLQREVGEPASEIAYSLVLLGKMLVAQEQYAEAEPYLRECLAIRREALHAGDWRIANTESLVGACLSAQARYEEAEPLLHAGYLGMRDDPEAPETRKMEAVARLVSLYDAWGKPDKAEEWRAKLKELTGDGAAESRATPTTKHDDTTGRAVRTTARESTQPVDHNRPAKQRHREFAVRIQGVRSEP